jgi:GxxExxY protein
MILNKIYCIIAITMNVINKLQQLMREKKNDILLLKKRLSMEISDKEIIKKLSERVYEQLGYGLSENAYQLALSAELEEYYDKVETEYHISQVYTTTSGKQIQIADLRIDILIENRIILELKSIETKLTKLIKNTEEMNYEEMKKLKQVKQLQRYQQITHIKEGYLINFSKKGLDFIKI